jgi:hypothetical protein
VVYPHNRLLHTIDYYIAMKTNKTLILVTAWTDIENIILSDKTPIVRFPLHTMSGVDT